MVAWIPSTSCRSGLYLDVMAMRYGDAPPEEDSHMKRFLASLAFVLVYACGVLIAWNTPGIANNLTPIFAIAWVFATNKIVAWMVKKAGWHRHE